MKRQVFNVKRLSLNIEYIGGCSATQVQLYNYYGRYFDVKYLDIEYYNGSARIGYINAKFYHLENLYGVFYAIFLIGMKKVYYY